jgi:hypothetical protein
LSRKDQAIVDLGKAIGDFFNGQGSQGGGLKGPESPPVDQ